MPDDLNARTFAVLADLQAALDVGCGEPFRVLAAALREAHAAGVRVGIEVAASLCRQDAGTFDREDERGIGRWHAARIAALAEKPNA